MKLQRLLLSIAFGLSLFSSNASAEDAKTETPAAASVDANCAVKQADLKGIIKKISPLVKKHLGVKADDKQVGLTESAVLSNKAKVIYRVSGCSHANVELTYRNVKPKNQTTKAFIQLALKMLKETPFESGAREPEMFETALKNVGDSPKNLDKGQIELKCGDASCAFDFREKTAIVLTYDMGL